MRTVLQDELTRMSCGGRLPDWREETAFFGDGDTVSSMPGLRDDFVTCDPCIQG